MNVRLTSNSQPTAPSAPSARGFTLIEVMLVLVILGIATALTVQALPPSSLQALERDGQRLQAHLDLARSYAQNTGIALEFRVIPPHSAAAGNPLFTPDSRVAENSTAGFIFQPVAGLDLSRPASLQLPPELAGLKPWLHSELQVQPNRLLLSPEPLSAPIQLRLALGGDASGSSSTEPHVVTLTVR